MSCTKTTQATNRRSRAEPVANELTAGEEPGGALPRCCRQRVLEELDQREGTPTADHLRIVLNAMEEPPPI
jgi:hypothetical protein